ncbi:sugar phosphate isomerase/epimerase [Actinotalea sp. M2MS4P-6]|uniref:sugar phosphate isomerase/epimerase family protein n=1 Tax=Actinotalea sp. M2MS4P-6 TaxID=2983762 RepID=UPI0021E49F63|nr:sugar phosphate isomerase/epimerase [Actinotalea sp. M2MS4P-6]MCV2394384.1 sugar phosphate isomerase/epimerase [Actinotalea sp. M2MS4P-6]
MSQIKTSVSMYSLQDSYARHRLDLEGVLQFVKDVGAQGVELISDQMITGTPFPSDATVTRWRDALDRSGLAPVCNDIFINSTIYKNRELRVAEQVDLLKRELDVSKRLGFDLVRLVSNTRADVTEAALPYAEQIGMAMALEIHAGMSFQGGLTSEWIRMMRRVQSENLGIVVDFGIFCDRHPRVSTDYFRSIGVTPEVADAVERIYVENGDTMRAFASGDGFGDVSFPPELTALFRSDLDAEFAFFSTGYESTPLDVLDEYFPYIRHFHGKFYEMLEDGTEYSIDYPAILTRLNALGYDGYISSEYEGNRFTPVDQPIHDHEQVRRHQAMLAAHLNDGK